MSTSSGTTSSGTTVIIEYQGINKPIFTEEWLSDYYLMKGVLLFIILFVIFFYRLYRPKNKLF